VNKMDLVGHDPDRFLAVEAAIRGYLEALGVKPAAVIPMSARQGENLAARSATMPWYAGPTVVEALEAFAPLPAAVDLPLRLPIQDVYKFDARRILIGRLESGRLRVGDEVLFSPLNKSARVASLEAWPAPERRDAEAGEAVGITLDEPLFIERGALASHLERPPVEAETFRARVFWLGQRPLVAGETYLLRLHTAEASVTVQAIEQVIDTGTLAATAAERVERNSVAEVVLRSRAMLAFDAYTDCPRTGRFVLLDGQEIAGGGVISMSGYADRRQVTTTRASNVRRVEHRVTPEERARRNGHAGGVIWLTGLSGSGKSTLAIEAERRLFARGYQVYVLDGDNLRFGLNADLGFSPEDRVENIRRAGEVAALFARAGLLVLAAFISPYQADRDRARQAAGAAFHEVWVKADLAICEARDPKGLYRKARAGQIADFTGVSAPYEVPEIPELVIDTGGRDVDACLEELLAYVGRVLPLTP
jgi:bifunctional enzyme CysN/CysC